MIIFQISKNLSDDEDAVNEAAEIDKAGKKISRVVSCVPINF